MQTVMRGDQGSPTGLGVALFRAADASARADALDKRVTLPESTGQANLSSLARTIRTPKSLCKRLLGVVLST